MCRVFSKKLPICIFVCPKLYLGWFFIGFYDFPKKFLQKSTFFRANLRKNKKSEKVWK